MPVGQQGFANQYQKPLGYQQIVSFSGAQTLTVPATATMAVVTVEGNAVRWRDDGTNASATVGMPVAVGASVTFTTSLGALVFFPQTGSATLDISYYA